MNILQHIIHLKYGIIRSVFWGGDEAEGAVGSGGGYEGGPVPVDLTQSRLGSRNEKSSIVKK